MLENLQNLVREHAGDAIINNPAIPNDKNDEVVADASHSILGGLKDAVAKGNVSDVMSLFNGGSQNALSSPVAQNIQGGFVQNLMHKFGLDQGNAMSVAASLIPTVLQKFVHKTNDPNDKSFDLGSIIGSLTGGGAGVGGKDILGNITGGGDENDGGLMGKIKGLF